MGRSFGAVLFVLAACQSANTPPFAINPTACPENVAAPGGKITHETYLRAHPELTHSISVTMRSPAWSPPACAGAAEACAALDDALIERQALNTQEVACVAAGFNVQGGISATPLWYEPARLLTSGRPVPIGTAFATFALWSQIESAARNLYVDRIEPAFGEAARIGVPAPMVPSECPSTTEPPEPKVADAASIMNQGRQPVVIELRQELLPPMQSCPSMGDELCEELVSSGWSRTIAATRMLTCVRRFIDVHLRGPASTVAFQTADGLPSSQASLPPFGSSIHALTAFGLTLTWDEVLDIARNPLVKRIWTSSTLTVDETPGCPPNYAQRVQTPTCPAGAESTSGKYTSTSEALWSSTSGSHDVLIAVRREQPICPQPVCPGRADCPERVKYLTRINEEAVASQSCVRDLIKRVGGVASPDVFAIGNAIAASLTWPQIQAVAAHPDVLEIDPTEDGTPPP